MWKRKLEVEVVKFLWKRKHFDERDRKRKQTRKRLILPGAGSGSKKFRRWGSGSELGSIKLQEELEGVALKVWLLPHPLFKVKPLRNGLKKGSQITVMFDLIVTSNCNIIKVWKSTHEIFFLYKFKHFPLEFSNAILHTERDSCEFEKFAVRFKRSIFTIRGC